MNIDQLNYICEVAKKGSLSSAAQSSQVTLSAISQSITALEAELGIPLFSRSRGTGAIPTAEGQVIISKAKEILRHVHELKEEAQSFSDTISGELKIATIPGPMHILVKVVSNFKDDYPNVKIELFEKGPREIIDDIQQDRIDLGLIILNDKAMKLSDDLDVHQLLEGKMVVGVSKHSQFALEKAISPEHLQKQTMVLYDDEFIHTYVDEFALKYGAVDILFTSNNTEAIKQAVKDQLAVTIALDYSFNSLNIHNETIKIIEIDLPDRPPIPYGWVRKEKNFSNISKRFLNQLQYELDIQQRNSKSFE